MNKLLLTLVCLLIISVQATKNDAEQYKSSCFRIQSKNYPAFYWGGSDPQRIVENSQQQYRLVRGLAGGESVSFQNCNDERQFLRHQNWVLKSHVNDGSQLFRQDASFRLQFSRLNEGYYSFESVNYPGHFIRHANYVLRIDRENNQQLYRDDGSFLFDQEDVDFTCYRLQSRNYQDFFWGETNPAKIVFGSNEGYRIVKGLSGHSKSISFQSCNDENLFLRHQNWELKLHRYDSSDLYSKDASFYKRKNHFFDGWYSFESVNYPGHFIRHQNYGLRISRSDNSDLFRNDAAFRFVKRKFFLVKKKNIKRQQ